MNGELDLVILQITPTRFRYLQVVDDFSGFVKRLAIFLPTLANFYAAGQVFIVVNDKYWTNSLGLLKAAAIAPWFYLGLSFCGFESQARHLRFFQLVLLKFLWEKDKTKQINRPRLAHLKNQALWSHSLWLPTKFKTEIE